MLAGGRNKRKGYYFDVFMSEVLTGLCLYMFCRAEEQMDSQSPTFKDEAKKSIIFDHAWKPTSNWITQTSRWKRKKGGGGIMSLQLPVFLESIKKGQKKLGCYIQQKTFKKSNF